MKVKKYKVIYLLFALVILSCGRNASPPGVLGVDAPKAISFLEGYEKILVQWDSAQGADSYIVFWGNESGTYPNNSSVSQTDFTITNLNNGTNYYFAVKSVNDGVESDNFSPEAYATPGEYIDEKQIIAYGDGTIYDNQNIIAGTPYLQTAGGYDSSHPVAKAYLKFDIKKEDLQDENYLRSSLKIYQSGRSGPVEVDIELHKIDDYGVLDYDNDWLLDENGGSFVGSVPGGPILNEFELFPSFLASGVNAFLLKGSDTTKMYTLFSSNNDEIKVPVIVMQFKGFKSSE